MNTTSATCDYTVEGNPDGPTLVFIHGWPDNASLWRKQVAELGADYRCVLITLPNFGEHAVRAGGFDFPELVARLAATICEAQPAGQVGLVTHDWGAYLGYLLEQQHPERFSRMAALDIGGHFQPKSLKEVLMVIGYQWALALSWLVGGLVPPLGTRMSKGVAKVIRVPSRQRENLRSRYNYPYFYLWRNTLLPWLRSRVLSRYRPGCPVLFLWGERKPLMFHSDKWLQLVEDSGGRAMGIPGAGHWLMETHAEIVNAELKSWFAPPSRNRASPPQAVPPDASS